MNAATDDQIDLMNAYVGKQEEFTVEIIRRYLELKAKYEILERGSKNNVELITELSKSSAESLDAEKRAHETLKNDFEVLQNNYLLTQKELHRVNIELGKHVEDLALKLNKKNKKTKREEQTPQGNNDEWI